MQLTDDTEAERYRKILLEQASQIELLKKQLILLIVDFQENMVIQLKQYLILFYIF